MVHLNNPSLPHIKKYSEAIREARLAGDDAFQSWFNKASNVQETIVRGYWDFSFHILTRKIGPYLDHSEEKIALEIGYGGGRLLNAACSFFKEAIGIDIHEENEVVETFLRSQGKTNFRLIRTIGDTIEVDPDSIDFVYSFIVLQHLATYSMLIKYVQESFRCLKPGGVAQLYFGKYSKIHLIDRVRYYAQGYKEITNASVNFTSLVVRGSRMKQLCIATGFEVIDCGSSYKKFPYSSTLKKGGQNYLTLLKR